MHSSLRPRRGATPPAIAVGLLALLPLLALLSLCAAPAAAKIVNVQSLAGAAVKQGFAGKVSASGSLTTGNVVLLLATGTGTAFYRTGDHVFMATVTANYGRKGSGEWFDEEDEPFRENVFEHIRYRYRWSPRWSSEAFLQHEYDRWRRLRIRGLAGIGMRADLLSSDDGHLALGLAYMAQAEELLEPQAGDLRGLYLEHRASSYVSASRKLAEAVAIAATIYVQPNLLLGTDIRGLLDLSLQVSVTSEIALTVGYWLAWDTAPPIAVRGLDSNTSVGLSWAF